MPATKKKNESLTGTPNTKTKQKLFWVIEEAGQYVEVTEQDIVTEPQKFLGKEIYEKPVNQYELIISLKKKSN